MPQSEPDHSDEPTFTDLNTPAAAEIEQLITNLQHSHDLRYQLINLETWALASTMDRFLPGFWSRFLANRRIALKQFLQQKRRNKSKVTLPESSDEIERNQETND